VPHQLSKGVGRPLTVTSVSCPSGIKDKAGTSYDCKLTIQDPQKHKSHSGTITIHVTKSQVEIHGASDLHVS